MNMRLQFFTAQRTSENEHSTAGRCAAVLLKTWLVAFRRVAEMVRTLIPSWSTTPLKESDAEIRNLSDL